MKRVSLAATAALLICCFSLVGCRGLIPMAGPSGGMINQTQNPSEIRAAIARALADQNYTVESEEVGKLIARMDRRGVQLRVQVTYTDRDYRIEYIDSVGLNYQLDPQTGQPMISRHYPRYVTRLDRTIVDELNRPAREAQEAIEDQREHELELAEQVADAEQARLNAAANERERDRQAATEQERLRTERARAQADAEYARRLPPPTIVGVQPVQVGRLAFQVNNNMRSAAVTLTPGFMPDPYMVTGQAAGRTSSQRLGIPQSCAGFWSNQPQQVLNLPQGMNYLRVDAIANEDVTLAIVTPDGQVWCDDDSAGGTNARLAGRFPGGVYAVYVGTYQRNRRTAYSLQLSELQPRSAPPRVAQPAPRPQRQRQAVDCRTALLNAGHSSVNLMHCRGAQPQCAVALLQAGHNPTNLMFCQGVDAQCAVTLLRNGGDPTELIHCD